MGKLLLIVAVVLGGVAVWRRNTLQSDAEKLTELAKSNAAKATEAAKDGATKATGAAKSGVAKVKKESSDAEQVDAIADETSDEAAAAESTDA